MLHWISYSLGVKSELSSHESCVILSSQEVCGCFLPLSRISWVKNASIFSEYAPPPVFPECSLSISWVFLKYFLSIPRLFPEYLLTIPQVLPEYSPTISWVFLKYFLSIPRVFPEYFLRMKTWVGLLMLRTSVLSMRLSHCPSHVLCTIICISACWRVFHAVPH